MLNQLTTILLVYLSIILFFSGTVAGSFLHCLAYRVAHKEEYSTAKGRFLLKKALFTRSKCPQCDHTLNIIDLIPIFGWIVRKGKCKYCKSKIPSIYPISEAIMGFATVVILWKYDISLDALKIFLLCSCLMFLSVVDFYIQEIPSESIAFGVLIWVCFLPFSTNPLTNLIKGAVTGVVLVLFFWLISLIMDKILKKESLGGGDIKLFGVLGLYLGPAGSILLIITSCLLGLSYVLIKKTCFKKSKKENDNEHFAFGPFISAAAFLVLIYGDPIINLYTSCLKG